MTAASPGNCACGFQPDNTHELADHLSEMFTPGDDEGIDGQVHYEQAPGLKCRCGLAARTASELDEHFRAVFPPPASGIGGDGRPHAPAPGPPRL